MLRLLGIAADAKARMLHEDAEQLRWRASDFWRWVTMDVPLVLWVDDSERKTSAAAQREHPWAQRD
ncbi:hypothetical protein e1012e08.tmp0161 [Eimeria tenella]|uniref:Uncharacterized protein n=1 Tax=Eimeria tenella TaxID=5802 RepID=C8TDL1_EIMTE|nr:hypothetical protein e1012e08.tmp0161 [Eimeria tenella]